MYLRSLTRAVVLRRSPLALKSKGLLVRWASGGALEESIQRYRGKLEEKARELGLKNVDELKATLKKEIEKKKKELNYVDPLKELEEFGQTMARERESKSRGPDPIKVRSPVAKDTPKEPYKTLKAFVDVEKVRELPAKELEYIWRARFQHKDRGLLAVLNRTQFASMYANAFKNPSFILPLPKGDDGYEMHFVQWSFVGPQTTHCMLTTVAEYKLHKEYAKPHTTLMFHQELAESNDVILMNGQVESDVALNMDEAQLLVLNLQRFYGGIGESEGNKRKLALLRDFTSGNQDFDMQKLISEATSFE